MVLFCSAVRQSVPTRILAAVGAIPKKCLIRGALHGSDSRHMASFTLHSNSMGFARRIEFLPSTFRCTGKHSVPRDYNIYEGITYIFL